MCSCIRKLLKWKADNLLGKGLRVEAAETCLVVTGAFNEVFGFQAAETQKLREVVKEITAKPESANLDIGTTGRHSTETSVNDNRSDGLTPPNEGSSEDLNHCTLLGEEGFIALIAAGEVDKMRLSLLLLGNDNPDILNKLLLKAFFTTQDSPTFEGTEIIRLMILSGSGCETHRFNSTDLMNFAVEAGNIPLAELLIKKGKNEKGTEPYGYRQLHTAIKNGNEDLVKVLLKSGGDVNTQDPYSGLTALCVAALHGQDAIARYLVSIGASVKFSTEAGQNVLSFAARNNHDALGKFLIDEELKASLRYIDAHGVGFQYRSGRTSLHFVTAEGNMNLVLALLDAGWDLNGGSCLFTPVLDAIYHNREHIAKFLIEKGSRIDQDLLKPAAEYGLTSIVRILLSKGVDANALSYGGTALEAAVTTTHNPEGRLDLVKLLLDNGANVRIDQGQPLVFRAAVQGYEDVTKLLIEAEAPLDGKRSDGATILHYAAEFGYLDVIQALVAKGVRLDVQDNDGRTPLHLAAGQGDAKLMKALLEAKPIEAVDLKNSRNCTALHEAVAANNVGVARVLVEYGASMTCQTYPGNTISSPLAKAVRERNAEIVQLFIGMGATLDEKVHGSIVRVAIDNEDLPTIKALLSADSKSVPAGKPSYATENIDYAIQRNKVDVIKLLLELGADITNGESFRLAMQYSHWMGVASLLYHQNFSALLPLVTETYLKAAAANNVKTIRFWLENNVPIDVKNKDGETALHAAAAKGAVEVLTTLLEANSTPEFVNTRSNTGATAIFAAIHMAKKGDPRKTLNIIKLLVQYGANHHIGLNGLSSVRRNVSTPRRLALFLGLSDIVSYFDELEKKTGELGSELEAEA